MMLWKSLVRGWNALLRARTEKDLRETKAECAYLVDVLEKTVCVGEEALARSAQRAEAERYALARAQRAEAERDALAQRLEKLLHTHETERAADIAIARALALDEFTKVNGHHK